MHSPYKKNGYTKITELRSQLLTQFFVISLQEEIANTEDLNFININPHDSSKQLYHKHFLKR